MSFWKLWPFLLRQASSPVAQDQAGPVLGAGASKASGDHCGVQLLSSQTGNYAKNVWWHFFGSCKVAPPWKPKDFSSWKCLGMDPPKELPNHSTHSQQMYLIWTPLIRRGSNIGRAFWRGHCGFWKVSLSSLAQVTFHRDLKSLVSTTEKCEKVLLWMAAESCQCSQC